MTTGTITDDYGFVELGEGYEGEYDPSDPNDVELLRLDYYDEHGEEVESFCTNLPVTLNERERELYLDLVRYYAAVNPHRSPRHVVELFSHMDPTWLIEIPVDVLALFGIRS